MMFTLEGRWRAFLQTPDLLERFRCGLGLYAAFLEREGRALAPYRSPDLRLYSSLDPVGRRWSMHLLESALTTLVEAGMAGESPLDSVSLASRYLTRASFQVERDVFDGLGRDAHVEVYSSTRKLLFWTPSLACVFGLTLEQYFATSWWSFLRRPSWVEAAIHQRVQRLLDGRARGTCEAEIETHPVVAIGAGMTGPFEHAILRFSPVRKGSMLAGFVVLSRTRRANLPAESQTGVAANGNGERADELEAGEFRPRTASEEGA